MTNLEIFAKATNNELFDPDYKSGDWMVKHAETHETLEMFIDSSKHWNEKTTVKHGEIGGFKFISYKSVQLERGDSRDSLSVVDLGDIRIVLHGTNLDMF